MPRKSPKIQVVQDPNDPDVVLAAYDPVHRQCRADSHQWSRTPRWSIADPMHNWRTIVCEACGSRKRRKVNINTYDRVGQQRYAYAKGYRTPKTGLTKDDFCHAQFEAELAEATRKNKIEIA